MFTFKQLFVLIENPKGNNCSLFECVRSFARSFALHYILWKLNFKQFRFCGQMEQFLWSYFVQRWKNWLAVFFNSKEVRFSNPFNPSQYNKFVLSDTLNDANIGLLFEIKDESRHNQAQDFSLTSPIRHIAPGFSVHFAPQRSQCQKNYLNCQDCMYNYYNPDQGFCYWCHDRWKYFPKNYQFHF